MDAITSNDFVISDIQNIILELVDKQDPLIVFDILDNQVLWVSKKFQTIYDNIKTRDGLESACYSLSKSDEVNSEIVNAIYTRNETQNYIIEVDEEEYDVEIVEISTTIVLLRLRSLKRKTLANSRYLEDREKLLFTSRSITVSEMASTLAHELNQPIGTLNNLLFGIKSRLSSSLDHSIELTNALDKSLEQIKYTSDIITRIRDYTQSRQPKLSAINIKSLINKCVSLMDWEIKNANIEFSYFDDTADISVFGDEVMLQQVIVNLIRNGIDASSDNQNKKTKIIIITKSNENFVEISIEDNGKGMTKQEADNIFIPFASNKSSGMGIGLNICRSFIELHKGKLWLSLNRGTGCTSHIKLPLMS